MKLLVVQVPNLSLGDFDQGLQVGFGSTLADGAPGEVQSHLHLQEFELVAADERFPCYCYCWLLSSSSFLVGFGRGEHEMQQWTDSVQLNPTVRD